MFNWLNKNSIFLVAIFLVSVDFYLYNNFWIVVHFYGNLAKYIKYFWPTVLLFEFLIFYIFVYRTIISPVFKLKKEIANFLTWWRLGWRLEISTSNYTMRYVINFFNKSLEILKNFKEDLRSGKELKSEVQLASEIQKNILTKVLPKIESLDIVANTKSASEVWWDSYDVIKQWDNNYIYIWDVTGHGVASWFVMMMVNALISGFSKMMVNSADIIAHTNEILKPRVPSNMLMTLLMIRWNEEQKKLFMTWAWHEYLLIYKKSKNKTYKVKSWWVALGMTKNIYKILKEIQIEFEQWDIAILYTDGITEARNTNKEDWLMFNWDKLINAIDNSPFKTAQWVFNNITIELSRWMWYNHKQFDDISLMVVHYRWFESIEKDADPVISNLNITEWQWSSK